MYLQGISPKRLRVTDKKDLEGEAGTQEEAEAHMKAQIPQGFAIIGPVHILSDGKDKSVEGIAETAEQAFTEAQKQVPSGAMIKEKSLIREPEHRTFTVQAFTKEEALGKAKGEVKSEIVVKSVDEKLRAKMGFLGIGKRPGTYMVNAVQTARARITYATKGKVRITVARLLP
jgi:D-alanine-D-alanine ligase-like ATP-grasp enzyme